MPLLLPSLGNVKNCARVDAARKFTDILAMGLVALLRGKSVSSCSHYYFHRRCLLVVVSHDLL